MIQVLRYGFSRGNRVGVLMITKGEHPLKVTREKGKHEHGILMETEATPRTSFGPDKIPDMTPPELHKRRACEEQGCRSRPVNELA